MQIPEYWAVASGELSRKDKVMAAIVSGFRGETLKRSENAYATLARAIVGQQISVAAAASVWQRLEKRIKPLTPEKVKRCRMTTLRSCGLSAGKALYVKNVAVVFADHDNDYWHGLPEDEVRKRLLDIKGVGEWTWQMFAIFHLALPDILPLGDLGLVNAIQKNYGRGKTLSATQLSRITDQWQPWRTVATWYLWRSIDPEPVAY